MDDLFFVYDTNETLYSRKGGILNGKNHPGMYGKIYNKKLLVKRDK